MTLPVQLFGTAPLYKDAAAAVEDRVMDLISRMTFEEKIGQLCSPTGLEIR